MPFFVALVELFRPSLELKVIGLVIGLCIVTAVSRAPMKGLRFLIIGLPFATFILAGIYRLGLPASFVYPMSSWKELIVVGLAVAAWRAMSRSQDRLDRLDWIAIGYVASIGVLYLVPHAFAVSHLPVLVRSTRNLALRNDTIFIIGFLAARHAPFDRSALPRICRLVVNVGTVIAAIAIFGFFFSNLWNSIAVNTFGITAYKVNVQHSPVFNFNDIRAYGTVAGRKIIRVGSTLVDPTTLGMYLLLPFAIAVDRIGRRVGGVRPYLQATVVGAALMLSQTRSAILGAVLICVLSARRLPGKEIEGRVRVALALAALVVFAVPAASHIGLGARAAGAVNGTEASSQDHVAELKLGVRELVKTPLGRGLGTAPGIGQRFDPSGTIVAENAYIGIGLELGVHAMVLFILLTIGLTRRARHAINRLGGMDGTGALYGAAIALAFGAFLLHIWTPLEVAISFWTVAGAIIGISDRYPIDTSVPDPTGVRGPVRSVPGAASFPV